MSAIPASAVRLFAVLIVSLLTGGLCTIQAAAKPEPSCLKCHPEFKKSGKYAHAALATGCTSCHMTDNGKAHPRQKESVTLKKEEPKLCFTCHKESSFRGKEIHPPVAEGKCTVCHNPHRSKSENLLPAEQPEFCFTCHDRAKFTKKYIHVVAMGRRCDCHNPHASTHPKLLSAPVNEICKSCHLAKAHGIHVIGSLPNGRIHPIGGVPDPKKPKTIMNCASCHNPHSSDYPKLYTSKRICKRCHKYY